MEQDFSGKEESAVGISQFISPGKQIPAITKYLISDFIVNQIDKDQKLVTLTKKPSLQDIPTVTYKPNFQITQELREKIQETVGEEATKRIQELYYQLQCGEKVPSWEVVIQKELVDKQERKKVHDFVRQELHLIQSQAVEGSKIKLKFNKKLKKMDARGRHKYIHFTLYKHGIDTFNAIFRLSKAVNMTEKLFSTAGLKDKRGHTTQKVSLYNSDVSSLLKFYKEAHRNREMWIANFEQFQDDKVEVGGLSGNQFGLILRLMNKDDAEEGLKRVQKLQAEGMINYFGLQRFGQFATKTYELGILYARKEWKQLVQTIILSDCNIENVNNIKRQIYESRKYGKAEKALANKYKIQKLLFKGLNRLGQNYQNVFESLPRSIKTLYTHSLQSYIWNKIASRRLKQFGLTLQIGDIVGKKIANKENKIPEEEINENQDVQNEQIVEDLPDDEQFEAIEINPQNIKQFNITDLILPLLGPQIKITEGTWLDKAIKQELEKINLTQQDFNHSAKSQNAKAAWRKMVIIPEVIESQVISHSSPLEQIQAPFYTIGDKLDIKEGELRSLRVVIRLPKSAYATMAIREMLHISSEFQIQKQLNTLYKIKYGQ